MTTVQFYDSGRNLAINVNGTKYNVRLGEYDLPLEVGSDDDGMLTIWNVHHTIIFKSSDSCTYMKVPIVNE